MKNLGKLFLIVATLGFIFNSCNKNIDNQEVAGEIPGMGDSGGKLKATVYDFHQDLDISSAIGVGDVLKSATDEDVTIEGVAQGSGDWVTIELTITNNNDSEWRSAYFRAGSVYEVNLQGYQNGILLAPVVVCIAPGDQITVTLFLYCLNKGKSDSDNSASYELLGVTESVVMLELVNALQGKMVNYEHYLLYYDDDPMDFYEIVIERLQEIVWNITNGDGMTDEDIEYIDNLPFLPANVYPAGIYDTEFNLPDNYCDMECSLQTAWSGNTEGEGSGWWYYYDASVAGQQAIYAGQNLVPYAYVEYINGKIEIVLGPHLSLQEVDEPVKINGYNTIPDSRPPAGQFPYKGTSLSVDVDDFTYYAIHLDVKVCE